MHFPSINSINSVFENNVDGFKLAGGDTLRTFTFTGGDFLFDAVTFTNNQTKLDYITVTQAVNLDDIELDIADLVSLTGLAANSTDLGSFTGVTIPDGQTIKQAFQTLETVFEGTVAVTQLTDLTDVSGAAVTSGNILIANGSTYVGRAFVESDIAFTDITTNNASLSQHGFLPKLSGVAGQFLNSSGNWTTPSGVTSGYFTQSFSNSSSVNVTHNFGSYPLTQVLINSDVVIPTTITHNSVNDFTVTFTTTYSGVILATLGSPGGASIVAPGGNYTVTQINDIILAQGSGSVITLDSSANTSGKIFRIKNDASANITIDTTGGELIDNQLIVVLIPDEALTVVSTGTKYSVL